MASRAFTNVMSALTLSGFVAEVLKKQYRDSTAKTIPGLCEKVWVQVKHARSLWPTCSDSATIAKRMQWFSDNAPCVTLIQLTSMALALLDDVEQHLSHPARKKAISDLAKTIGQINRYYDRRMDKADEYEKADSIVDEWRKVLEA